MEEYFTKEDLEYINSFEYRDEIFSEEDLKYIQEMQQKLHIKNKYYNY